MPPHAPAPVEDSIAEGPASVIELRGRRHVARKHGSRVPAIMESNLARKGMWHLDPARDAGQMVINWTGEDIVGGLEVTGPLGQLGDFELRLLAWVLGRFRADTDRIQFSLRECGRDFGISGWGGKTSDQVAEALRRIARTRIDGVMFDAATRRRRRMVASVCDVVIDDRSETIDGPSLEGGSVTVRLSPWMLDQLHGSHFTRLNFETLQHRLPTPLARRLYVLLEAEQGFVGGRIWERTIDKVLLTSLGITDANGSRVRQKLNTAGEALCKSEPRYEDIRVRRSANGKAWVLSVRRQLKLAATSA